MNKLRLFKTGFKRKNIFPSYGNCKSIYCGVIVMRSIFARSFMQNKSLIDPVVVYKKLANVSPNPFSALYRVDDKWLICASPERFLKKQGNTILSQPIKGTSKRITG